MPNELTSLSYHAGNYAPIHTTLNLRPCPSEGAIPEEFFGGQYVRNGSKPLQVDTSRGFHWFNSDGMLTSVFFERIAQAPGVTTLISPRSSVLSVLMEVVQAMALIVASLWGLIARPIRRTSTSNTSVVHNDDQILATNETGPPMRVFLPSSLKTVGWFTGMEGFIKEMTTAHPHVDPQTQEMFLFHATFLAPFTLCLNQPEPGFQGGEIMHDFGVSRKHTVMIDMPYNWRGQTRFGVFPRYEPEKVKWYTSAPCMIMHTVNTWDEETFNGTRVHLLLRPKQISHQWALSAIPFEFPHVPHRLQMAPTRFVYGNSMRTGDFAEACISNVKVECLVKIDVVALLARGLADPPSQVDGCVDQRSVAEVLISDDPNDPIKVFALPDGWYAQECSFVARKDGQSEDDGWLVTYVYDELQLDENGAAPETSQSVLWIIDALEMKEVVARVLLPQRVPYGMHGNWFPEEQILGQREVERFRK
ncbi:hypothetical protein ASPACDRAFT_1882985 [Aspergillus aculeatus ATCC 16872]|uniref:Carotenoid oxygenase n=1 Tax=Aspergillus aculeatus (strain ATCC 16872 / CBS 172.66 / WB 5094) TaxID=690307 RepID=A0A1L9WJ37_ASPA1|nr:uncharacterized protein ASPACDRAFT_1882985 [Aspergillus aculeatus ATCC 16872]OJJ96182.1 hypothetical protein ASPACDRAFT_1882985 [Aspergillus aculeatus ATCC 16872]